ncbi:MAG: mechanosensitive ion channel family protein [Methanimicrococcus sp.]|nr:mechanosensitive ion channel family protein [Methanimicrococcus sp.]
MALSLDTAVPYTHLQVSNLVIALIILIIGVIIVHIIAFLFRKLMKKSKMPELAANFFAQFVTALLYVAVLLAVISYLGVTVSSLILGLSAVIGLILGFGLQDTLNNLAAGVWIAVLEPFKESDLISVAGQTGYVASVGVMATQLITADNVFITIPNKMIWNNSIINMTHMPIRRFDLKMTFKLVENSEGTVKAVLGVLYKNSKILQNPEPKIYISNITDATADLEISAWVNKDEITVIAAAVKEELLQTFEIKK